MKGIYFVQFIQTFERIIHFLQVYIWTTKSHNIALIILNYCNVHNGDVKIRNGMAGYPYTSNKAKCSEVSSLPTNWWSLKPQECFLWDPTFISNLKFLTSSRSRLVAWSNQQTRKCPIYSGHLYKRFVSVLFYSIVA